MKLLAVEASTKKFSLAVGSGEKILRRRDVVLKRVLSSSIIPAIQTILGAADLPLAKLDGLVVGLGPGSFTSLRVGLSTVKALAYAADLPVVGISSLDAVALAAARTSSGRICVLSDARRDMAYAAVYDAGPKGIERVGAYHLAPLSALIPQWQGPMTFTGDGLPLFRPLLEEAGKRRGASVKPLFIDDERLWYPRAADLVSLALPAFRAGRKADLASLVPLYLYPEDCQIRR